jgi:hypothetical protein
VCEFESRLRHHYKNKKARVAKAMRAFCFCIGAF